MSVFSNSEDGTSSGGSPPFANLIGLGSALSNNNPKEQVNIINEKLF